jgi:hypothetical protein
MRRTIRVVVALGVTLLAVRATATAQTIAEVRVADTKYRYVDVNHTWGNGAFLDIFYVGAPGANELNMGLGRTFKLGPLALTPAVYAVVGKEGGQRGVTVAVLASGEKDGWKLLAYIGHFTRVSGDVASYDVTDTMDVTHSVGKRVDIGVQWGYLRVGDEWNHQVGPLMKINDSHGNWAASYRFGVREFRVARVVVF